MKPYILGAIFARGSSKGVPHKNVRLLSGKPLIAYAIEVGCSISLIDRLIVSTDDEEIAAISRQYGAEVPFMRPKELAGDNSPELLSWQHAIRTLESMSGQQIDVIVSIPPTAPLRLAEDVQACVRKLLNSDADVVITMKEAERNPYFNMVSVDVDDNARLVFPSEKAINQRQQAPRLYDISTVAYAARVGYIRRASSLFEGRVKAVTIPVERAMDIDTILDFEIAEYLMTKRNKGR